MNRIIVSLGALVLIATVCGAGARRRPVSRAGRPRRGAGQPARGADGGDAADHVGGDHRAGADVRLDAVAAARQGAVGLPLRGEGVFRHGHRQRPALQDASRRPAAGRTPASFSGLVLAESMHGSGSAHMFEFTSTYTMSSGHAAVEILTTSPMQFVQQNQARYKDLQIAGGQASEILAQVGALVRTGHAARRTEGPQDGARGHVDERRDADQLPAGAQGVQDARDAARSTTASTRRRTARSSPTSTCRSCTCRRCSRSRPRTSPIARTATSPASSIASTRWPAWPTSTRATACG